MIFVTVGNLDPFDRLVRAVDEWIARQPQPAEVFAQIGTGSYKPTHCRFTEFLSPAQYREVFSKADLIVSHAGMGTIITALEHSKPIIILPKLAMLGEQRNDHQVATARRFRRSEQIRVAEDVAQLHQVLDTYEADAAAAAAEPQAWQPDESLVTFIRSFIAGTHAPAGTSAPPPHLTRPTKKSVAPKTTPQTVR